MGSGARKAKQALALARYLDRQTLTGMQLDTIVLIVENKARWEEGVARHDAEVQALQGRWSCVSGEEIASIVGKTIIWADERSGGSIDHVMTPLRISPSGKLEISIHGQQYRGQFDKHGTILWNDGEEWTRSGSLPLQEQGTSSGKSGREGDEEIVSAAKQLDDARQLRREIIFQDSVALLSSILENAVGDDLSGTVTNSFLDIPFTALGLTSTELFIASHRMSKHFKEHLPWTIFFDFPTVGDLAAYLVGADMTQKATPSEEQSTAQDSKEIGYSRFAHRETVSVRRFSAKQGMRMGDCLLQLG